MQNERFSLVSLGYLWYNKDREFTIIEYMEEKENQTLKYLKGL